MITILPPPKFVFEIDIIGEEPPKQKYQGKFIYHKLTNLEKNISRAWYLKQLKTLGPDEEDSKDTKLDDSKATLAVFAAVRCGIEECPQWWTDSDFGTNLYDFNVVAEIFGQLQKLETKWSDKIKAKAEDIKPQQGGDESAQK